MNAVNMDPAEFQLGKTKIFIKTPESVIWMLICWKKTSYEIRSNFYNPIVLSGQTRRNQIFNFWFYHWSIMSQPRLIWWNWAKQRHAWLNITFRIDKLRGEDLKSGDFPNFLELSKAKKYCTSLQPLEIHLSQIDPSPMKSKRVNWNTETTRYSDFKWKQGNHM